RSLHLDLEHHWRARAQALLELRAQRAVAAPGIVRVLDERALGHVAVELIAREEVVVDAIALARARRARGRRHGELESVQALHQPADQRPLADPRGARDHEHARHESGGERSPRAKLAAGPRGAAAKSALAAGVRRALRSS